MSHLTEVTNEKARECNIRQKFVGKLHHNEDHTSITDQ